MPKDARNVRRKSFETDYLAWIALSHLLPVTLARELFDVIAEQVDPDGTRLDQLFDEVATDGPESLRTWCLSPRKRDDRSGAFMRSLLQAYAWAHDASVHPWPEDASPDQKTRMQQVAAAVTLGRLDFAAYAERPIRVVGQPGIEILISVLDAGPPSTDDGAEIDAWCARAEAAQGPLDVLILKQAADLLADADRWRSALHLYVRAERRLAGGVDACWSCYAADLRAIVHQSKASALRTIVGAKSAAEELGSALSGRPFAVSPLLSLNAGTDDLEARASADDKLFPRDDRAFLAGAPLLVDSHDFSSALASWHRGRYADANRAFWAVLRRQTALGAANASRWTKTLYAQCLLEELARSTERHRSTGQFIMAVRLLLEGEDRESADWIAWNEAMVALYVDEGCIGAVTEHADRYEGVKGERKLVAVGLFKEWTLRLPPERTAEATAMLTFLASTATDATGASRVQERLAEESLAALGEVAERRPHFLTAVRLQIVGAAVARIGKAARWPVTGEAIKTATTFLDAADGSGVTELVDAVLAKLEGIDPAANFWPVVAPSLGLLTCSASKMLMKTDPLRGEKMMEAIVRFGTGQETEHARLLYYLDDIGPGLLRGRSPGKAITEVVKKVRAQALQYNSTAAVGNIQALILAAAFSGRGGFFDAVKGLRLILESATTAHRSLCFAQATVLLLLLLNRREKLVGDVPIEPDELEAVMQSFVPLIVAMWSHAVEDPLIFTTFSLPPATTMDKTVAHNWAFASIQFARAVPDGDAILAALDAAGRRPELHKAIAIARASRMADDAVSVDPDDIEREDAETFYAAAGQRLVSMRHLHGDARTALCTAMVKQCLRFGPTTIDVGVFLSALDYGVADIASAHIAAYEKKMRTKRDLHLTLYPVLYALGVSGPSRPL